MRVVIKLVAFSLVAALGGALLAAPLTWVGQALGAWLGSETLTEMPMSRYFDRAVLLVAVLAAVPLLRSVGVRRWTDLELVADGRWMRRVLLGFGVGSLAVFATGALIVLGGGVELRSHWHPEELPLALLTGVLVAAIEEPFFRGALFGALRRGLPPAKAASLLSVYFAILHFLHPDRAARKLAADTWWSGFTVLPHTLTGLADPVALVGGLFTLVIFGAVMAVLVLKTRSLWLSAGLHAGFVFGLKAFVAQTRRRRVATVLIGRDLTTGLVPAGILLLSAVVLWYVLAHEAEADRSPAPQPDQPGL